jgi:hypothetical protein
MEDYMRAAAIGAVVCLASWLGLWAGAGYIGLSRSVAVNPLTLLEVPMALVLASALAFVAALGLSHLARGTRPLHLVAWVLVGDLIGAAVLAPLAIGELKVVHAPVVFAAISALGMQPLAAGVGAWAAAWGVRSRA